MRKDKFQITDLSRAEELYDEMVGRVGITTTDGYPRIIPVNFVYLNKSFYFHGATAGEKFDLFKTNPKITFQIDKAYSVLPSNWFDSGCNATICYKSVYMKANGFIVEDNTEKAVSLQALMEKHQDIGTFIPITANDPTYVKVMKATAIFRVDPIHIDIKFKFAQSYSKEIRQKLVNNLKERNEGDDLATALEIEKSFSS